MANGRHEDAGPNIHPSVWATLIGVGGLILGIGGSVIWVGGALKQIDVDGHRIDTLFETGSPKLQALAADMQSMRVTLSELTRQSEKTGEVILDRGKQLAAIDESIRQISHDLRSLETRRQLTEDRWATISADISRLAEQAATATKEAQRTLDFHAELVKQHADVYARLAALEGKLMANDKEFVALNAHIQRLRDDLAQHSRDDQDLLRDNLNQWRSDGLKNRPPITRDAH